MQEDRMTGRRRTGRRRTGCRRKENTCSRGRTINQYRPQKNKRNLEYSIKVDVNVRFNTFNILNGLVMVFFSGLKGNGHDKLMDQ